MMHIYQGCKSFLGGLNENDPNKIPWWVKLLRILPNFLIVVNGINRNLNGNSYRNFHISNHTVLLCKSSSSKIERIQMFYVLNVSHTVLTNSLFNWLNFFNAYPYYKISKSYFLLLINEKSHIYKWDWRD